MFWTKLGYGVAAGAAGVTTLNAITYLDMAVRARPSGAAPSHAVEQLAQKAGAGIPGQSDGNKALCSAGRGGSSGAPGPFGLYSSERAGYHLPPPAHAGDAAAEG